MGYPRVRLGAGVKHSAKGSSVQAHGKFARLVRGEATIHDPKEFMVKKKAHGDPQSPVALRPLPRSMVDIRRLARTGNACPHRYHVTARGRTAFAASPAARNVPPSRLQECAGRFFAALARNRHKELRDSVISGVRWSLLPPG